MESRKLQKLIDFGKNYGASETTLRKVMEGQVIHVTVYSHERGYTHDLCSENFFALDLAPRADDKRHVLYTPARRPTDRRDIKRRATILSHFAEQLEDAPGAPKATCDRCILIANVVIANKCDIAYAHGMRHLKNLLETT